MKSLFLATLFAFSASQAFADSGKFSCYGEDGSDLSISVDLNNATASLNGEDVARTYSLNMILESNPPQYVFGDINECSITFRPNMDYTNGSATFQCNSKKYPDALNLEMDCSLE